MEAYAAADLFVPSMTTKPYRKLCCGDAVLLLWCCGDALVIWCCCGGAVLLCCKTKSVWGKRGVDEMP